MSFLFDYKQFQSLLTSWCRSNQKSWREWGCIRAGVLFFQNQFLTGVVLVSKYKKNIEVKQQNHIQKFAAKTATELRPNSKGHQRVTLQKHFCHP